MIYSLVNILKSVEATGEGRVMEVEREGGVAHPRGSDLTVALVGLLYATRPASADEHSGQGRPKCYWITAGS